MALTLRRAVSDQLVDQGFERSGRTLRRSRAIAYLRRAGWPEHAVPLFPEPGGLLGWGRDQNGAQYFWDTSSSDPETWGIVVDGRPVDPPMQRHRLGLTGYLDALRSGAVKSASYADWPSPDARIGRRAVE